MWAEQRAQKIRKHDLQGKVDSADVRQIENWLTIFNNCLLYPQQIAEEIMGLKWSTEVSGCEHRHRFAVVRSRKHWCLPRGGQHSTKCLREMIRLVSFRTLTCASEQWIDWMVSWDPTYSKDFMLCGFTCIQFWTEKKILLPKYSGLAWAAPPRLCSGDFLMGRIDLIIWEETDITFFSDFCSHLAYK